MSYLPYLVNLGTTVIIILHETKCLPKIISTWSW